MFERFTDRARRVVVLAQKEAKILNHNYIGTEHILLGLVHEGEGVAFAALTSLGISLDEVRDQVEDIIGKGQQQPTGHIPFTPRAKKVLELALRDALQLGHNYIGTEHILLGLIREGDGVGAYVLVKLGVDLNRVRQQTIQLLSGYIGKHGEVAVAEEITGKPEIDAPEFAGVSDPYARKNENSVTFSAVRMKAEKVSQQTSEPVLVSFQRQNDGRKVLIKLTPLDSTQPLEVLEVSVKFRDHTGATFEHMLAWPLAVSTALDAEIPTPPQETVASKTPEARKPRTRNSSAKAIDKKD